MSVSGGERAIISTYLPSAYEKEDNHSVPKVSLNYAILVTEKQTTTVKIISALVEVIN